MGGIGNPAALGQPSKLLATGMGLAGTDTPSAVQPGRGTVKVRLEAEEETLSSPSSSQHPPAIAGDGLSSMEAGCAFAVSVPDKNSQTVVPSLGETSFQDF